MRGIFIVGVVAAFAITVVDSLSCAQCNQFNSTCYANATECKAESLSCVEFYVNSTLGGSLHLYQNKFCSALNCTENSTEVAFTVRLFDDQRYHFASQCCQGEACNSTYYESKTQNFTAMQCMSCYGHEDTACEEKPQWCYEGEQCVHIIAQLTNDTGRVELKGCSDITSSTCQFLSTANTTVGEFAFQLVNCMEPTESNLTTITPPGTNTSFTSSTPPGGKTSVTSITTPGIKASTTSVTPQASLGIKVSFTSSIFSSLLLLKLLF
ncbi:ly6/PLAUR domain-containing protein 8-like [Apodemus sylvaticus]|uniref:ly6/PLAUR domain-containing protein 8-like n=1 Tax=Apodemus sylvaticus TaxID=10129 RepID=UPI002241DC87|nr:ly6/PLAUR domain-containing protein 8-like [Apodemus sylvaticus]